MTTGHQSPLPSEEEGQNRPADDRDRQAPADTGEGGNGQARSRNLVANMTTLVRQVIPFRRNRPGSAPAPAKPAEKEPQHKLLFYSFVVCVIVPSFLYLAHTVFLSSDVYVSEVKLTVRDSGDTEVLSAASSVFSKIGINKPSGTAQDSLIALDYIKSRAIIDDVGGRPIIKKYFSGSDIDYASRLDPDATMEKIWKYWRNHVTASVDTQSNILTVRVRAFSPEDARNLAQSVTDVSEQLVNRLSQRSRRDTLERAREEVDRAAQALASSRSDILAFQQKNKTINPIDTAKRIGTIISNLTLQRIEIDSQLATGTALGLAGTPAERQMQTKLGIIDKQIANLEGSLTDGTGPNSVSSQLRDYELLRLREEFAETIYTLSRTSFEQARRNMEKQQLYLAVIAPPFVPEYPLYPKPILDTALVFAGLMIFWGIGSLLTASVYDSLTG